MSTEMTQAVPIPLSMPQAVLMPIPQAATDATPVPVPVPLAPDVFSFRLYVAGDTQNSIQALRELSDICDTLLANRHEIEVVDVFSEPERALADGIFLTPMLLKLSPLPMCRIVGTLGQRSLVLRTLGLPAPPPVPAPPKVPTP